MSSSSVSASTGYPDLDALQPRLEAVPTLGAAELEAEEIAILGRKSGSLTAALKRVATLPVEERKRFGAAVNQLKVRFESAFAARREVLEGERKAREQAGIDLTMPGRRRWTGAEHPVTRVVDEIVEIFRAIGFTVAVGPEVETEWYNFLALNFPPDHPAMDMHDTLYLDAPPAEGEPGGRLLLRTHTSPVQIRALMQSPPPVRVVIPGMVYRNDAFDPSHSPAFSQVEGLAVDEGISFVDLKATLIHFAHRFFGPTTKTRFRPSFFHRALGGDGRRVPALPRQRLPRLQGDGVDGDSRLRDGASGGAGELQPRLGALHRLGVRHGAASDRHAALRNSGHPAAAGGGHAVPGAGGEEGVSANTSSRAERGIYAARFREPRSRSLAPLGLRDTA